jgi:HSP20 family molecular chaperone IbpA
MLVPRRNSFDLFDNFFGDDDFFTRPEHHLMKTDIKEKKDKYLLDIDLPGFNKENIDISLNKGYLNIKAKVDKEEKNDEDEKFVRRERYYGECSRSFYVGEDINEDDIHAEFKNGILKVEIPKKEALGGTKEVKQIPIK